MTNPIDQIIDIDKDACGRVEAAKQKARDILDDAEAKRRALTEEYNQRIAQRIAAVDESYARFADEDIAQVESRSEARIAGLRAVMEANADAWAEESMKNILGEWAARKE